ncbi:hypothetical protein CDD80_2571 [Ophiocordyceps camponoti-rufipedis]|uniref:Uncharacterized protein n=1 Tax=Ophiocordyceps camponoti-rufipedis TaxID=2004952 RepID=A0A2C5XK41_9HYPO|nr:hypothetical protein CDD80_2571 [Ophiocordyceps camponoti-rufipedis]
MTSGIRQSWRQSTKALPASWRRTQSGVSLCASPLYPLLRPPPLSGSSSFLVSIAGRFASGPAPHADAARPPPDREAASARARSDLTRAARRPFRRPHL